MCSAMHAATPPPPPPRASHGRVGAWLQLQHQMMCLLATPPAVTSGTLGISWWSRPCVVATHCDLVIMRTSWQQMPPLAPLSAKMFVVQSRQMHYIKHEHHTRVKMQRSLSMWITSRVRSLQSCRSAERCFFHGLHEQAIGRGLEAKWLNWNKDPPSTS